MGRDYYAILGVTPTSEDVVIRAAYRALMRRYHPDADPSSEASQRAQAINAAYAVLSDPDKRRRYDGSLAAQGLIKPEPGHGGLFQRVPRPSAPALIALTVLAAAIAAIAISPPVGVLPPDAVPEAGETRPGRAVPAPEPPQATQVAGLCSDPAVAGLIKQELMRRAAQARGASKPGLEQAAPYSVLRIDSPAGRGDESGAAGCNAFVALDLPPGLAVDGGRTNLNAEIGYEVTRSAGGAVRLASLSGAGALVRSLATLGPAPREPQPAAAVSPEILAAAPARPPAAAPSTKPRPVQTASLTKTPAATAPPASLSSTKQETPCRLGNGWADRAICNSGNLSGLDRQLAQFYSQSWAKADDKRRAALLGGRARFQERRNACRSEDCLTAAYLARLREISDIMAKRSEQ